VTKATAAIATMQPIPIAAPAPEPPTGLAIATGSRGMPAALA